MKKNIIYVSILCLILGLLVGCGKKGLEGTWNYYSSGQERTDIYYTFKSDKTGSYTFYGEERKFTYEDDHKKVTINYENATVPNEFEYKIEDDILTIKDSFGSDVTYKRK